VKCLGILLVLLCLICVLCLIVIDYLKIKAYMPSIAEDVGMGINITDVPLENASPSDMNLINISIDDGEHEQHSEDWTSKLGVNLQYSMKLRKQSTLKQEWLTLALGRIFSNPVSLSDFSTLKWHSRRSRTPSKVVGVSAAKSHFGPKMEKSKVVERNLNANFTSKVKNYQSCRRNPNDTASKHHGFKNVQNECGSGNGSSIVNVKDDYSTASRNNLSERVEDNRTKGLFTVPVSSTEDLQMLQGSWFPLKVGRANEVTNFDFCESRHPCVLIPVLECSDTRQGTNSPVQFLTKCRVNDFKNQEPQPHQLEPEVVNSEVPDEIETLDEINSGHEAYNNVESGIDPTSQEAVTYTGDIQDIPVLPEYLSRVSGLGNYLLSADQSHVPALSNDSAEKLEVSISDDSNLVNVSHSLKPVGQLVSNQSTVDSLLVQQKEIPVVKVSVEASREDIVDHSSKSDEQVVSNPSTIIKCRIQQKEIAQLGVPIGGEPKMEGRVNPSLRSRKHFVNHPSSADRRGMRQELSTAEEHGENGNDDHSSRSERLLVSNLSMLDATSEMQQEIPTAESNLQRVSNVQLVTQQNASIVVSSEVQHEISANGTNSDNNVNSLKPVVDSSSVNSEHAIAASAAESFEVQESVKNIENFVESSNKNQNTVCIIQYVRRRTKRKREEQMTEGHHKRIESFICSAREEKPIAKDYTSYNSSFIRGPCEGLRPRAGRGMGAPVKVDFKTVERNRTVLRVKSSGKDKLGVSYECEVQGCRLKFRRKQVLNLHMQNRCTYRGCGKQFRSHKDLMRHLRVHDDERPLKCPWKGCRMSFKWEWARTEHFRIHTGERPYQCAVAGCELTFRYVSDFSRHRRKTGHYVNATDH